MFKKKNKKSLPKSTETPKKSNVNSYTTFRLKMKEAELKRAKDSGAMTNDEIAKIEAEIQQLRDVLTEEEALRSPTLDTTIADSSGISLSVSKDVTNTTDSKKPKIKSNLKSTNNNISYIKNNVHFAEPIEARFIYDSIYSDVADLSIHPVGNENVLTSSNSNEDTRKTFVELPKYITSASELGVIIQSLMSKKDHTKIIKWIMRNLNENIFTMTDDSGKGIFSYAIDALNEQNLPFQLIKDVFVLFQQQIALDDLALAVNHLLYWAYYEEALYILEWRPELSTNWPKSIDMVYPLYDGLDLSNNTIQNLISKLGPFYIIDDQSKAALTQLLKKAIDNADEKLLKLLFTKFLTQDSVSFFKKAIVQAIEDKKYELFPLFLQCAEIEIKAHDKTENSIADADVNNNNNATHQTANTNKTVFSSSIVIKIINILIKQKEYQLAQKFVNVHEDSFLALDIQELIIIARNKDKQLSSMLKYTLFSILAKQYMQKSQFYDIEGSEWKVYKDAVFKVVQAKNYDLLDNLVDFVTFDKQIFSDRFVEFIVDKLIEDKQFDLADKFLSKAPKSMSTIAQTEHIDDFIEKVGGKNSDLTKKLEKSKSGKSVVSMFFQSISDAVKSEAKKPSVPSKLTSSS